MADVTLVLKADNSNYIQKTNEAQKATQQLNDTASKGMKQQKGLIEDIENELTKMEKARKKAFTLEDIEKYNRKIAEAKQNLKEYDQAGVQFEKQTESMTQSIGKWALSLGGAAAILMKLGQALKETTSGLNAFNIVGAVTKQVLNDIVTGMGISIERINKAIEVQRILNDLRLKEVIDVKKAKEQQVLYNKYYFEASDRRLTDAERIKKYDQAMAAHNKMIDLEVENTKEQIAAMKQLTETQPGNEKVLMQYAELQNKLLDLESQRWSGTKRIEGARTGLIQEGIEKELKWREDFGKLALKYYETLAEEEDKINKENAEKRQKQFKDLKKEYQKLVEDLQKLDPGKGYSLLERAMGGMDATFLFDADQQKQVLTKLFVDKKEIDIQGLQWNKTVMELNKKMIEDNEKLQEETLDAEKERIKQRKEAIINLISELANVAQQITDNSMAEAQRQREILDTQISEAQQSLESEIDLYEAGYASNVAAKKKQIEDLKKLRDQALRKEEEAAKKQRQIDTITQVSALITASAKTFQAFPGPLLPVAIAVVAAMFAAFAASKVKSAELTKLASGGSGSDRGMITGRTHAQGGERFLSQVEVERGEAWGVLSVPATQKFGKVFHHMVSSFNKGEIPRLSPITKVDNNVLVENSGPNERLDRLIFEQKKLNEKITSDSMQDLGSMRVIRKGSTTRIIKR